MSLQTNYSHRSVDNSVSFTNATVVAGIGVAWSLVNPASALGYLATTVGGTVGSLFACTLGEIAYERYNKWRHQVAPPLLVNEKTSQYGALLNNAFEKIKTHPNYELFKQIRGYESDEEAFSFFQSHLRLGYCFGSVASLLHTLSKNPHIPCSNVLNYIDLEQVFYFQALHFMQAGFQVAEKETQRALQRAKALSPTNFWNQMQGLPLVHEEEPDKLQRTKDLETQVQDLQTVTLDIQKTLIPWEEICTEPFAIKGSPQAVHLHLETLLKSKNQPAPVLGRAILRRGPLDWHNEDYEGGSFFNVPLRVIGSMTRITPAGYTNMKIQQSSMQL